MQHKIFKENKDVFEQLLAIKANNETVLKSLYENNYSKVEKYVLNNSGTTDQAKDIYQEAYIAVWRNIQMDKFSPETESALTGYLFQIARNKWLDYMRSNHFKKNIPLSDFEKQIPDENESNDDEINFINNVKKQFEQLGENCRELLNRFYYKKESMKIIAEFFNWTDATARNNKYRCLQHLRELVKKQIQH
jgi:RNA polymerase sigma factor (sigma-70 family)